MHRNAEGDSFRALVDRRKIEHEARDQIRKQSLDPYNRLHSIAEDIEFVQAVYQNYSAYPLLANLRCGAWYCDSRMGCVTVHFKSADGHYNGWSFNLRRPNLHILPLIRDAGGICIVDSTRSGKRMPDSLSKTVPIWCAVVNRASMIRGLTRLHNWDVKLNTPPQCVSKQEYDQIEVKADDWAISLAKSSYDLPALDKPLRPIWVTPASSTIPRFGHDTHFIPIICISASKLVEDGAERRRNGYSYVQGAGDDHENWSQGLQPDVFWEHKDELLKASQADFPCILTRIVGEARSISRISEDWVRLPTPVAHVHGLLSVAKLEHVPNSFSAPRGGVERPMSYITVRRCPNAPQLAPVNKTSPVAFVHEVAIPNDKKAGERVFKASLPGCLSFIRQQIQENRQVCIACESGKDLSVGVAVVALQAFFDDTGMPDLGRFDRSQSQATKESIRSRLHWVISSRPEANPARATLKRVNEFFMSARHPVA